MIGFLKENFQTGAIVVFFAACIIAGLLLTQNKKPISYSTGAVIEWLDYEHATIKIKLWNQYVAIAEISPKVVMETLAWDNEVSGAAANLSINNNAVGKVNVYMSQEETTKIMEKLEQQKI